MKWTKTSPWGDYSDPAQNHKDIDYKNSIKLKNRNNFKFRSWNHRHIMSKRYADNHQKL